MMHLGYAKVSLGASGLGMERVKSLCLIEDLEENLNKEVRETNEMAPGQAPHGWVANENPWRVGWSRERPGIGGLFCLLCHFKFADLHTNVLPFW